MDLFLSFSALFDAAIRLNQPHLSVQCALGVAMKFQSRLHFLHNGSKQDLAVCFKFYASFVVQFRPLQFQNLVACVVAGKTPADVFLRAYDFGTEALHSDLDLRELPNFLQVQLDHVHLFVLPPDTPSSDAI